ncbi:transposase [Paraburkholderia youngii]|uniref:IS110 family transposase n=1 Tax=Paraburkholderia youngii TaxID=2782701 RepID=UPI003D2251A6
MNPIPVGVDIPKSVIQVHWVDPKSGEVVNKAISRDRFLEYFANRPTCLIGMEACGGAHHWARQLMKLGHQVKLMPPKFVKAFNIGNKSDPADARAIWMLDRQIAEIEQRLRIWMREDQACKTIAAVPGVGLLTATAAVATMGDATAFRSGREFAAWIGLVPKQTGSGGKVQLLGISRRGDSYLRTLLIHGARSVLRHPEKAGAWIEQLAKRRPFNVVIVALANKLARTIWALLAHNRQYQSEHVSSKPA